MAPVANDSFVENNPPPPKERRFKLSRACDRCRRRRIKCDEGHPCQSCLSSHSPCTFEEPGKRTQHSKSKRTATLEDRMHHLETLIQNIPTNILDAARAGTLSSLLSPSLTDTNNNGNSGTSPNTSAPSDIPSSAIPPPHFTLSNPSLHFSTDGTAAMPSVPSTPPSPRPISHSYMYWDEQGCKRWQGETSGLPLLDALFDLSCTLTSSAAAQQEWRERPESPGEHSARPIICNTANGPFNASSFQTEWFPGRVPNGIDAFNPETLWKVVTAIVAPDLMDTLIQCYLSTTHYLMPFLHIPSFLADYSNPLKWGDPGFVSLILSICCLSSRHVDDPRLIAPSNHPSSGTTTFPSPASTWFELLTRLRLLPSASLPTLPTIQSLLLSAVFSIGLGKLSTGLSLLSSAITLSFDAGLHRSVEHYTSSAFTPIEREMRKRTFWGIYLWDKQAAAMFGRPCLIRARDCDVGEPSSVDDEFITNEGIGTQPYGIPSRMGSFIATIRYYIILESVLELPLDSSLPCTAVHVSLLPNRPSPNTLSPMSLHPPNQHQLFFPSASPTSPHPSPPQMSSNHFPTSPYPSPSYLLSTLATLRTCLPSHWTHTPETLASEDVIRVTQAVRLHCLERFIGMLIWRGRLSAVITSVSKEDSDASSSNSASLSASDEALTFKMGDEEKEALKQCYAYAKEIVGAYLCTATKGLMTYYGVHVIHQLTQTGRTLIAVVLCLKSYLQSQGTVSALTPSTPLSAPTPVSPTSPVSTSFQPPESSLENSAPCHNNNVINPSSAADLNPGEVTQLQALIGPSLEALRSCVSLLKRFSGRYVCGMRNGDLLEEFCRSQIPLAFTSSSSTAPSSTQPTAPSTPHPPSSPRGSSVEPSVPTSPTSGVPSRPPWLKPIPITRKRRSHSTLNSSLPISSRARTTKTPPDNSPTRNPTYHYTEDNSDVNLCFRENDLMVGVETNISGLDMGLNRYHGANGNMNLEHDNDPILSVRFGAEDEHELGRSHGDVFLGVGIDIEMGTSGYGMHQTPVFHQSGRHEQPLTPELLHHPHLFAHSPNQSHSQHDLDIISLLNESSFDNPPTCSASSSKSGGQSSPSVPHKRPGISESSGFVVSSHSSQPHEVYVGLSDYGMGSLAHGDHNGISAMHLSSRGIPANLGIGIITSP